MPFEFACPACGQSVPAREEDVGRHGSCPSCAAELVVPAAPTSFRTEPNVPVSAVADRSRDAGPRRSRPLSPGWRLVSIGVLTVQLSLYGFVLAYFLFLTHFVLRMGGGERNPPPAYLLLLAATLLGPVFLGMASSLMAVVGHILMALVPTEAEDARVYAIIGAVCFGMCMAFVPGVIGLVMLFLAIQRMSRSLGIADAGRETVSFAIVYPILTLLLGGLPLPLYAIRLATHLGSFRRELQAQLRQRGVRGEHSSESDE